MGNLLVKWTHFLGQYHKVSIYDRKGELIWSTDKYPTNSFDSSDNDNHFNRVSNVFNNTLQTGAYFLVNENKNGTEVVVSSHTLVVAE